MLPNGVKAKIRSLRSLLRRLILLAGLSRVILITVGFGTFCLLVDWTFHLSPAWRLALGLGCVVGLATAVYWFLVRPMLVSMPDDQLALLFERRFPELSDLLVSAVQLAPAREQASGGLVAAVISAAESASAHIEAGQVPRLKKLNRMAAGAAVAAAAVVAWSLACPASARIFAARYVDPFGPAEWPRKTRLIIEVAGSKAPHVSVAKGDQVAVKVTALNARGSAMWTPPRAVWLDYQTDSGEKDCRPMRGTEGDAYLAYFNDVLDGLVVSAWADGARTDNVRIDVVELPRVEDAWLSFEYPEYTGMPPDGPTRSSTEIRAITGTRLRVQIKASRKLKPQGARIVVDPTGPVVMRPTVGNTAADCTHEAEIVLAKGMKRLRIELVDTAGHKNKHPKTFQMRVREDKPPELKITKPGGPTRCTPYAVVPLQVRPNDDLALRRAWLRYSPGPKQEPRQTPLGPIEEKAKEADIAYRWDMSEMGVKVGQTISYRAEAEDFRDVFPDGSDRTRQVGKSKEYFVSIVPSAELASELDRRLFALRDKVKKARTRQEADQRKVNELLRKMSEGQPMTNDDRAMAAGAENVQRELARFVDRVAAEIGTVRQRMQDNRIGSFADRRRLGDVRDTLESIAKSDMHRSAGFIKNARKNLDSRNGRDNLQTAAGIQKTILARLDRVLAEMSHNEDIGNLVRAARELLMKQRKVKDNTAAFAKRPGTFGASPNELKPSDHAALNLLVRRQNSARDDMRNLEQEILNVFERLTERDPKRAELVRKAQVQASRDQIRLMMEEASTRLAVNRIGLAA